MKLPLGSLAGVGSVACCCGRTADRASLRCVTRVDDLIGDLIGDLDAAIEGLRLASTTDQRRRALTVVLAELYKLRSLRVGKGRMQRAYYARARAVYGGRVAEGISLIRGDMTHDVTKEIDPSHQMLHPGMGLLPGEHLHPGPQLIWLHPDDMAPPHEVNRAEVRFPDYEQVVGRQPVLTTLVAARDFLANDPGPCL